MRKSKEIYHTAGEYAINKYIFKIAEASSPDLDANHDVKTEFFFFVDETSRPATES